MNKQKLLLEIAIIAMIDLVVATAITDESLAQRVMFLIGALVLTFVAFVNKQKMFFTIELVVNMAAILAFWSISPLTKYEIFAGGSAASIYYLIATNFSKEDKWWPIGACGLLMLAAGFATDAAFHPLLFRAFLGIGSIFVAIYSAIGFFFLKVKIAMIWLILNIFFSISPLYKIFF